MGALALVLYDQEHGASYLYDQILASVLERLVEKHIFVTLVLDCCFSGSYLQHSIYNKGTRVASFDPSINAISVYQESIMDLTHGPSSLRDAYTLPQWLVNPNYTVLTAYGPHQIAEELETDTKDAEKKERRDALSYFLIEALILLQRSGVEVTCSSLHQHLLTKFHRYWPCQTPMRCGNKNLSFFGELQQEINYAFIPIFKTVNGCIYINKGQVHDVHRGDEYALYSLNISERKSNQANISFLRFRVNAVRCFISDLAATESISVAYQIDTG